jgi:hypothetical protein
MEVLDISLGAKFLKPCPCWKELPRAPALPGAVLLKAVKPSLLSFVKSLSIY